MKVKKPKNDDEEYPTGALLHGLGFTTADFFNGEETNPNFKKKEQIGFIRQKDKKDKKK